MRISELLISIAEKIKGVKTDILAAYDAIASKDGKIPIEKKSRNLADAINTIPAQRAVRLNRGGELGDKTIFVDYDGTILYAYTQEEIQALEELPVPYTTHDNLTFQQWNWSLAELKSDTRWHNVGAHYYPTDGLGTMEFDYTYDADKEVHLRLIVSAASDVYIDWGDGAVETLSGTLDYDIYHTYANGKYTMRYKTVSDSVNITGFYVYNKTKKHVIGNCIFPKNTKDIVTYGNPAESGAGGGISGTSIEILIMPYGCNTTKGNDGNGYASLSYVKCVISSPTTWGRGYYDYRNAIFVCAKFTGDSCGLVYFNPSFRTRSFDFTSNNMNYVEGTLQRGTYSMLERLRGTIGYATSAPLLRNVRTEHNLPVYSVNLSNFYSAKTITLNDIDYLPSRPYKNNYLIEDYKLPVKSLDTTGSIPSEAFINNYNLRTITIHENINKIEAKAFANCERLYEMHIKSASTQLSNTNAFSGTLSTMKIYVPADSVETYKTATNWSTYADRIVPEIEETEPDTEITE